MPPLDESKTDGNKIRSASVVLAIAILGAIGFYFLKTQTQKGTDLSFYDNLIASNSDFSQGEHFYDSADYPHALEAYEKALEASNTDDEEGQIRYKMGLAYRYNNEPLKAIPIFKTVAADPRYPATTRAYAVQSMGQAFYSFNDPAITTEIFADEPYTTMFSAEDIPLSYRRLFEYASTLYPLGIPETRVAEWYAQEIVKAYKSGKAISPDYKDIIRIKLQNADIDIERTSGKPEKGENYIPEILNRKAHILGLLSQAGDESFGDPEEAFAEALRVAQVSPTYEAQGKYYYALFLAEKYGNKRAQDIQNVLSDFYTSARYENTGIVRFIKNEKNNTTGNKSNILLLASLDPQFKEFLKNSGWTF